MRGMRVIAAGKALILRSSRAYISFCDLIWKKKVSGRHVIALLFLLPLRLSLSLGIFIFRFATLARAARGERFQQTCSAREILMNYGFSEILHLFHFRNIECPRIKYPELCYAVILFGINLSLAMIFLRCSSLASFFSCFCRKL